MVQAMPGVGPRTHLLPESVALQVNVIVPLPVVGPARLAQSLVVPEMVPLNFDFPSGNTRPGWERLKQPPRVPEMVSSVGCADPGVTSGGATLMIPLVTVVHTTVSCELSYGVTPAVAAGTKASHPASGTAAATAAMTILCLLRMFISCWAKPG